MNLFSPTSQTLFFSKNDPADLRLGDLIQRPPAQTNGLEFSLGGYPDDEAIGHNGGRKGASQGPDAIRKTLYRMTPPAFSLEENHVSLTDVGNLAVANIPLVDRHKNASEKAKETLKKGHHWIGLGGGHDYGFPDGEAFLEVFQDGAEKPLVINFDAHLDVRPLMPDGPITSGSPFYRLLSKYQGKFDFVEVGLQPFCNSKNHFDWLKDKGGIALTMDDLRTDPRSMGNQILSSLDFTEDFDPSKRPCFLSVDIDVFSSSHAPGCSQSWPSGMTPLEFFPCMKELCNIFQIQSLGIYEVSPPLDQDEQTAKLAAEIIYNFLFQ